TYAVSDISGNSDTEVRTVNVVDTTAPVITILGDTSETVQVGAIYTDAGATAYDVGDGDLTALIITTTTVNTFVIGSYSVTYAVSDISGNSDTEVRTVDVVDTTAPVINSVSLSATRVNEGDIITFTVDVTDNQGVDSVELVTNSGSYTLDNGGSGDIYTGDVDTTGFALDTYSYTITATDDSGNTDTATGTYEVTIVSPMTVHIVADKTSGEEDLDVSFASYVDAGGVEPLTYSWSFGDGDTDSSKNVRHVFTSDGTYTVTLTVRDQYGNDGTASIVITVSAEESSSDPRNNIKVDGVSLGSDVIEAGETLEAYINVENIGDNRLRDLAITISIPELGIWITSTADDVRSGDEEEFAIGLDIPDDVAPGVYDVRIVISTDDMKRIKHRDVEII
ncbi:MAG: immunoglobulin-like domain-containing protein, partial [Nanoarchaeota archaeon]